MKEQLSKSVTISAIVISIIGGIFFGLFSCGGYVWHMHLFTITFTGIMLFVFFIPPKELSKVWKRIVFVISVSMLFFVVRAGASTFYPASPETWEEFFVSFIRGIQYGPC